MKQWHPLFAALLERWVHGFYQVAINVPVGDLPREADIVLVRRTTAAQPPFQGIWKHLTQWNVLEFKGPSVVARRGDVDNLVEVGLGINRRLNQERRNHGQRRIEPAGVSFWYLANRLSAGFLTHVESRLGALESLASGLWRCKALSRLLFLVSRSDLAVEPDSIPLHLVTREPVSTGVEVGKLLLAKQSSWESFGEYLPILHEPAWKELKEMAKTKSKDLEITFEPLIEYVGMKRIVEKLDLKRVLKEVSIKQLLANLDAKQIRELKEQLK